MKNNKKLISHKNIIVLSVLLFLGMATALGMNVPEGMNMPGSELQVPGSTDEHQIQRGQRPLFEQNGGGFSSPFQPGDLYLGPKSIRGQEGPGRFDSVLPRDTNGFLGN